MVGLPCFRAQPFYMRQVDDEGLALIDRRGFGRRLRGEVEDQPRLVARILDTHVDDTGPWALL